MTTDQPAITDAELAAIEQRCAASSGKNYRSLNWDDIEHYQKDVPRLCAEVRRLQALTDEQYDALCIAGDAVGDHEAAQAELRRLRSQLAQLSADHRESTWHDPPQVGDVRWVRQTFTGDLKPAVYPDVDGE